MVKRNARPKKHYVYTVDDLCHFFGARKNTVSNWVKEGLRPSDDHRPYVFRGSEVARFQRSFKQSRWASFGDRDFQCRTCQKIVEFAPSELRRETCRNGSLQLVGVCPTCSGKLQKFVSATAGPAASDSVINKTRIERNSCGCEDEIVTCKAPWKIRQVKAIGCRDQLAHLEIAGGLD